MSVIDEVKSRIDIVDLLSQYVTLQKAGRSYKALCPFHSEKTPSFSISPERQTWYCFGACSTGGDQIKFLQRLDGLSFMEALELLAARTGVELPRTRARQPEGDDEGLARTERILDGETIELLEGFAIGRDEGEVTTDVGGGRSIDARRRSTQGRGAGGLADVVVDAYGLLAAVGEGDIEARAPATGGWEGDVGSVQPAFALDGPQEA